jgi:hypothetical protein
VVDTVCESTSDDLLAGWASFCCLVLKRCKTGTIVCSDMLEDRMIYGEVQFLLYAHYFV